MNEKVGKNTPSTNSNSIKRLERSILTLWVITCLCVVGLWWAFGATLQAELRTAHTLRENFVQLSSQINTLVAETRTEAKANQVFFKKASEQLDDLLFASPETRWRIEVIRRIREIEQK